VGQNQSEDKLDYYLRRQIDFRGTVATDGSEQVTVTITEHNTAPAGVALPDIVAGARSDIGLAAGIDRTYMSVLVPQQAILEGMSLDGQTVTNLSDEAQLGKRLFATYMEVAQGASSTLQIRYDVPGVFSGGTYRLTVQNQAMVHPDALSVHVQLPGGYQIADTQGLADMGGGALSWTGKLTEGVSLSASASESLLQRIANAL